MDDFFEFQPAAEAAPELVLGKKKKKKKKKDASGESSAAPQQESAEPEIDQPASAFAALDIDEQLDDDDLNNSHDEPEEQLDLPVLSKKKKKKKKKALLLDDLDEPQQPDPVPGQTQSEEGAEPVRRVLTAAEKKKAKKERERLAKLEKANKERDDLNSILAELDAPADNPSTDQSLPQASMTAAQNKSAKKNANEDAGESVDALLAELDAPVSTSQPAVVTSDAPEPDVDDLMAEFGAADAPAAKKKSKKKKKKGAAKPGDSGDAINTSAGPAEPQKTKKKESAAVRRMREMQEKQMVERERLRQIEEEEKARVIAEEQRLADEAKRKEEEKAKKKAAEKARKERRRQEGTLLSKAEKEKRRKAEAFRKQLLEKGLVPAAVEGPAASDKPKRIVYGNRKKPNRSKPAQPVEQQPGGAASASSDSVTASKEISPEPVLEPELKPEEIPTAWDEVPEVEATADDHLPANGHEVKANNDSKSDEEGTESETSDDSDDSEYEGMSRGEIAAEKRLDAIRKSRRKEKAAALAARTPDHLRSPIICILGHVDTGKTKILDRIRRTNVQDGEAGGITQQIGATYFPIDAVKKEATKLAEGLQLQYNVPSLLIIDTPGHESFTNLRSRGSSLCDIAILVIDIMHGLEDQTRESIDLLKLRKTPFIVALNKIDRIYDWNAQPDNCPARDTLAKQPPHAREEFKRRVRETKLQLAEVGFNTELYWDNKDVRKSVSLVPTSAITGEGIPDLLMLLLALPQKLLTERLMFNPVLEATVLEVKVIEGLGTTIDIILTGGTIYEGDTLVVVGLDGPIVATIRALLTPHPMKEMRVKGQYVHHKKIEAAQGVKISADGLEKAVAGTQVMVVKDPNDEDEMRYIREEVVKDFQTILNDVDKSGLGVYVQASTLGSLEALLEFLRTSKIPVSGINIGPVHKRDVTKASTMLEKRKEFATILAFDVPVEKEARELAEDVDVKIFTADIIYHLFDQFTKYMEDVKKQRREEVNDDVVFPSICKILPQHIYNKKDPIILGVDVMEGILRVGTPLVVRHGEGWLDIGRVASIELSKKQVVIAGKGESVAVKIQHKNTEHIMYGRHFDFQDALVSKMSRPAIELLKESFRDDLGSEDWRLVVKLRDMFRIV